MTDFRAELQALLAAIEDDRLFTTDSRRVQQAIDRARAALAETEPPSLKQQALGALDSFEGFTGSLQEVDTIRRALEQLDD